MIQNSIQESLIDATDYISNLRTIDNISDKSIPLLKLYQEIVIKDQFGSVSAYLLLDRNRKSLQDLNYFLNRKQLYQKSFSLELRRSIYNSLFLYKCISLVLGDYNQIYFFNSNQQKIQWVKGRKILKCIKIRHTDPKYPEIRDLLLCCAKYFVIFQEQIYKKRVIFINLHSGKCEQPIIIKNSSYLDTYNTAISTNGRFLYITPTLYFINSLAQGQMHKYCNIYLENALFSQDQTKLVGYNKNLSNPIVIIDCKGKNAIIHQFRYDFSKSLNGQLYMHYINGQLTLSYFKYVENDKYYQSKAIFTFDG